MVDPKEIYLKFEEQGEDHVREALALKNIAGKNKMLAEAWLEQKERERADALADKDMEIKESHLKEIRQTNKIAKAAIIISIIALLVSIAK